MEYSNAAPNTPSDLTRVAIIEDNPAMLEMLTTKISEVRDIAVVAFARTAAEGRVMIEDGGFNILLCDLGLPDGNGIDLISLCAKRHRDVDIMVVTMFAEQRKVLDCIRAGARGYLHKDQDAESCVEAIREVRRGGSPISPLIARQLLLHIKPETMPGDVYLTDREHDVLNMLARGFSRRECADLLGISVNSLGTHVKNMYRKLEVNSQAGAVFEATNQGIIK